MATVRGSRSRRFRWPRMAAPTVSFPRARQPSGVRIKADYRYKSHRLLPLLESEPAPAIDRHAANRSSEVRAHSSGARQPQPASRDAQRLLRSGRDPHLRRERAAGRFEKTLPKLQIPVVASVDAASAIVTDHLGRRWRLPKTDTAFDAPANPAARRPRSGERALSRQHPRHPLRNPACHGQRRSRSTGFSENETARDPYARRSWISAPGAACSSSRVARRCPARAAPSPPPDGKVSLWFGKTG